MSSKTPDNSLRKSSSQSFRTAGLLLLLLTSRVLLVDHPTPVHGDETEFISALGFPAAYPVHQPGYPLWVAMGTLLAKCGAQPYASFQAWSVICSVLAPWVLYLTLRREMDDGMAWWTALAFGACPLLWFLGTTALNYATACAVVVIIVAQLRRAMNARRAAFLRCGAATLALSSLLRPDLLIWLGPIVIVTAWSFKWLDRVIAIGILALGTATVVAVQSWLYGRAPEGMVPQVGHTMDVVLNTSVFRLGLVDGLARNALKLGAIALWQLGLPILISTCGCLIWGEKVRRPANHALMPIGTFFMLWTIPLVAFLILIHMTEAGHILVIIPGVYWLIAHLIAHRCTKRNAIRLMAGLAVASTLQFVLYPWSSESHGLKRIVDAKLAYISATGLRHIDERDLIHTPGDTWHTAAHGPESAGPATNPSR